GPVPEPPRHRARPTFDDSPLQSRHAIRAALGAPDPAGQDLAVEVRVEQGLERPDRVAVRGQVLVADDDPADRGSVVEEAAGQLGPEAGVGPGGADLPLGPADVPRSPPSVWG